MPDVIRQFDEKNFNPEVFGRYVERVPKLRRNELLRAGVFRLRPDLAAMFPAQTGGNFATIPMFDYLKGDTVNFDGKTNIPVQTQQTFQQSIVVKGEAAGFTETDFSYSMTGVDFMSDVASQLGSWRDDKDEDMLLAIIRGIYNMTGTGNAKFVDNHTTDLTGQPDPNFGVTTLNTAIQKASGDNKQVYALAIMNSMVATRLENIQLLEFWKYTDANGVQRQLPMATLNGKTVFVDDYGTYDEASGTYITHILGRNMFDFFEAPVLKPFSMARDESLNGGMAMLYTRFRRAMIPRGISFTKASMASLSPEYDELENGANWELVHNQQDGTKRRYFNHKDIPIVRILTKES